MSTGPSKPQKEILLALKMQADGLLASEIAGVVGTSTSAVRPHIDHLVAAGLVTIDLVRHGLGRPRHRYTLTALGHADFPNSYREIASAFLEGLLEFGEPLLIRNIFARLETSLVQRYAPRMANLDFPSRLKELTKILDERGYMTHVEKGNTGYILVEHNCPVADIADRCNSACESELHLIEQLVDAQVTQLEVSPRGGCCRYEIRERPELPQTSSTVLRPLKIR